jgi:hypothetical protein
VCHVFNNSNGPLMSERMSLMCALAATVLVPHVQQYQRSADVRGLITVVGARSNRACATCPTVATVHDVRVPVADVGASSNRTCATCPTIAMNETRPLLLGHDSSDGTAVVGHLPFAAEGYESLLETCIVVVGSTNNHTSSLRGSQRIWSLSTLSSLKGSPR